MSLDVSGKLEEAQSSLWHINVVNSGAVHPIVYDLLVQFSQLLRISFLQT